MVGGEITYEVDRVNAIRSLVADSSALIHAHQAGFLEQVYLEVKVLAPASICREVAADPRGTRREEAYAPLHCCDDPAPDRPADEQALLLASLRSLPLVTDDLDMLGVAHAGSTAAYPSLAVLELLLLRGGLDGTTYEGCRRKLAGMIRYPDPVYRACRRLHWEVRKLVG